VKRISGRRGLQVSSDRSLLDSLDRHVALRRRSAAILGLRRGVHLFARKTTNLYADVAVDRVNRGMATFETGAMILTNANTERAGLAEDKPLQCAALRRITEDGQKRAGRPFS
jgi:hypothetical protein